MMRTNQLESISNEDHRSKFLVHYAQKGHLLLSISTPDDNIVLLALHGLVLR
jgi:hypothetical protein